MFRLSQKSTRLSPVSSTRVVYLGLESFILGLICCLAPNAIASPLETSTVQEQAAIPQKQSGLTDGVIPQTSALRSESLRDRPCPAYTPITNTIAPDEAGIESEATEDLTLPTSDCAADLTGDGSSLSTTQEFVAQENTPDNELESPSESPSNSEAAQPDDASDRWHFKLQPYVTLPVNTYGTATVKGRTANYHLDLIELLNDLTFNINGRFEVWKSNIGFIVDASYVNLNSVANTRRAKTSLEAALNYNQGIYDFAFSYHLGAPAQYGLPEKPSNQNFPQVWFEPIAGVRLNDLNSTIEASLNFERFDRTFEKSASKGRTWFEPMLGGKLGVQVSDSVTFWLRGDASGFGLAGDTDMSWNIIPGMDWWVSPTVSLQFAYRFYQIDYGNGSGTNEFRFEQSYNGPYLAATFHF